MTAPVYDRWGVSVFHGDNLDVLRDMPDCSIDSVVTDPPAGIAFMGKAWDTDRGGRREWVAWLTERMVETLRVLKPGGHALVWSMPRTSHWTGWALEDAGFEVRDVVQHVNAQGMAKSLDIAKAIDKQANQAPLWDAIRDHLRTWRDRNGLDNPGLNRALGLATNGSGMARHWTSEVGSQHSIPSKAMWALLKERLGWPDCDLDAAYAAVKDGAERPVVSARWLTTRPGFAGATYGDVNRKLVAVTAAATEEAKRWEGWGTGLAPHAEPWWLCRKPMGYATVADNVLKHSTGALNIAAARDPLGNWPANVAHFPKAPAYERPMVGGDSHVSVKSVALCRWLVRLVTPPGGTVLDLFAGTGPVGQAARAEGFKAVLIEQDAQAIGFIRARLDARAKTEAGAAGDDGEPMDLLDLLGGDAS